MPSGRTETGRKDQQDWKEELAAVTGSPKTAAEVPKMDKPVGNGAAKSKKKKKLAGEEKEEAIFRGLCLNKKCLEGLKPGKNGALVAGRKKIFDKFHAIHEIGKRKGCTCSKKCDTVFLLGVKPYNDKFSEEKYFERLRRGKLHRVRSVSKEISGQRAAD